MKVEQFLLLFIIPAILFSCDTTKKTQQALNTWIGKQKSELILQWGPPNRTESDGKGGDILVYERKQTTGAVIAGNYYENTTHPYTMFYADKDGKIYFWRTGQ